MTVRKNPAVRRATAAIPEHDCVPIPYWLDDGADVAETIYTAFAGTKHEVTCRLLVRRVRPTPGRVAAGDERVFDHHTILTDRDGPLLDVQADHHPGKWQSRLLTNPCTDTIGHALTVGAFAVKQPAGPELFDLREPGIPTGVEPW